MSLRREEEKDGVFYLRFWQLFFYILKKKLSGNRLFWFRGIGCFAGEYAATFTKQFHS